MVIALLLPYVTPTVVAGVNWIHLRLIAPFLLPIRYLQETCR